MCFLQYSIDVIHKFSSVNYIINILNLYFCSPIFILSRVQEYMCVRDKNVFNIKEL